MSLTDNGLGKPGVKTLAIRLEPDQHAQLVLIAQLRSSTITDEIRSAIEAHIITAKTAPELTSRADAALEDIERDADARRAALTSLFGDPASSSDGAGGKSRSRRSPDSGGGSATS